MSAGTGHEMAATMRTWRSVVETQMLQAPGSRGWIEGCSLAPSGSFHPQAYFFPCTAFVYDLDCQNLPNHAVSAHDIINVKLFLKDTNIPMLYIIL